MPTATPDAIRIQEEQYRQPIIKKEKVKPDSDWSQSLGKQQVGVRIRQVKTLSGLRLKNELKSA
jgi:hypothetical protein